MRIIKKLSEDVSLVTIVRGGISEHIVNAAATDNRMVPAFTGFPHVGDRVLNQFVFGGTDYHGLVVASMPRVTWPLTWVHGDGCSGEDLAGCQAYTISGVNVTPIRLDDVVLGMAYHDDDAAYCWLGGLLPADPNASRAAQTRSVFERMEAALARASMTFCDTVRTWFFLDNLLDWYDEFNVVRTAFFTERGVFDRRVPASTGIGAANPAGASLVASALAVKPKHDGVTIAPQPSPLQCPATSYRSSFSRAMEIEYPDRRCLYISGTASIDSEGRSVHLGDVDKQIDLTMRVADALLRSRGMAWSDVVRAIAYFKDITEAPRLEGYCRARALPAFPISFSHAAVCRHDLLYEIELDAVVRKIRTNG
jgi:enamine deaminase RidA (YjgF/YER057c/UK114 family)